MEGCQADTPNRRYQRWTDREDALIQARLDAAGAKRVPNRAWENIAATIGRPVYAVQKRAWRLRHGNPLLGA